MLGQKFLIGTHIVGYLCAVLWPSMPLVTGMSPVWRLVTLSCVGEHSSSADPGVVTLGPRLGWDVTGDKWDVVTTSWQQRHIRDIVTTVLMSLQTLHTAPPPSCHIQTSSQQHDPSTWYWQVLRTSSFIPAVLLLFTLNRQSDQNTAPCFVTSGEYRMWYYRDRLVTWPLPPPSRDSGTQARGSDTVLTQ